MEDWTVGDIFEEIAERVAAARTRALMGERQEALTLLQCARIDFLRFREVLRAYPGSLALEHSLETAQAALCEERCRDYEPQADLPAESRPGDSSKAA
jgi:hypothetical protein